MRALTPWRPFRELSTLHKDLDELFSDFFGEEPWMPARWTVPLPAVESFVKDGELVVRADLPGIDPKEVELSVEGRRLILRGERRTKEEHKEKAYFYREVGYGRFERSVELPDGVDLSLIHI